jgi:8-oxo-dGTP pyrophosphatase MutT (NUDIX family)
MAQERWIAAARTTARIAARLERALASPRQRYEAFRVEGHVVGWIIPERVQRLLAWPTVFVSTAQGIELAPALDTAQARTSALAEVARALGDEGELSAWRDERYAVAADSRSEPLFALERAAARYFGIHTFAAHANGLCGVADRWRMWLARRSPTKAIDPGLLDNLVGGGIAEDSDAESTLRKEAFEEAGIAPDLARRARAAGTVEICRDQSDGLQRETIHVYDLWLPEDFTPRNQDGEAVEHLLCEPQTVVSILDSDDITADASLVIVDFLLRSGCIARDDRGYEALSALRWPAHRTFARGLA